MTTKCPVGNQRVAKCELINCLRNHKELLFSEDIMELRSEYEMNQIMQKSIRPPDIEKHAIVQVVKSMLGELHSLRSLSITTYAK